MTLRQQFKKETGKEAIFHEIYSDGDQGKVSEFFDGNVEYVKWLESKISKMKDNIICAKQWLRPENPQRLDIENCINELEEILK